MLSALRRYRHNLRGLQHNARLYLLSVLLGGLGVSIYGLFFNLYVDALGMSRQFLGNLQALSPLLNLVLALPMGLLSDRIGRKRALVIAKAGSLLTLAGFLLARSPGEMFLFFLLKGALEALFVVTEAAFMVENSNTQDRTALFSLSYGLATLVGFLGNVGGGYLPRFWGDLLGLSGPALPLGATLWVTVGLQGLALLPLLALRPPPQVQTAGRLDFRRLWEQAGFLARFLLTILIGFGGAALVIPYLNLFFRDRFNFSPETLGWIFALSQGITGLILMLAPLLAERWGRIRSMTMTGLASIPLLLLIGLSPLPWIAVGALWLRAGLMRIGNPLYDAFYLERFDREERATASSLQRMAFNLGWAGGSWLSGQLQERAGGWPLARRLSDHLLGPIGQEIPYGPAYVLLFLLTALAYLVFLSLVYLFFARQDRPPVGQRQDVL